MCGFSKIGGRIVITCKEGRESARAAFDAQPLFQGAESVHILEFKEQAEATSTLGHSIAGRWAVTHQTCRAHVHHL
jgi:hypothetical protein